jgi:hypothetical protein
MYRRTALLLAGMTLLGLAVPQSAFAQSEPFAGLWQLNVAKSKYSGQSPKSRTAYLQPEGQNIKDTLVTINADGTPGSAVTMWDFDGMPHPQTGNPNFDAIVFTRPNTNTAIQNRLRAGQIVWTVTMVLSPDGKTTTVTGTGTLANGQPINVTEVYEKQQ